MDAKKDQQQDPTVIDKLRALLAKRGAPISTDVNTMDDASKVGTPADPATNYAEGGKVMSPKEMIGLPGVPDPTTTPMPPRVAAGLPGVPALPGVPSPSPMDAKLISAILAAKAKETPMAKGGVAAPNANTPHKAPDGPSDDEKRTCVAKALKEKTLKLDNGGAVGDVDASQLPVDAPQDSKLQAILKAMGMAGSNIAGAVGDTVGKFLPTGASLVAPTAAATNAVTPMIPGAVNAMGNVAGAMIGKDFPQMAPVPTDAPAATSHPASLPAPQPTVPQAVNHTAPQTGGGSPDPLAGLGKFDPTTVAPGMNPSDRQALANNGIANQHTFGNYLSEALGGIGDALAARGGVQQNSLGSIIGLQKQQRDEALSNFDKAREIAVQNHMMKNQADQDLINNIKARGETLVSPDIARSLGHPEWANKPVAQVSLALNGQKAVLDYTNQLMQRKQGALKDAAESVDQALKSGGIGGTQKMMDPQSRLTLIHKQAMLNDPEAFGYSVTQTGK